jgi:hypothetical protein
MQRPAPGSADGFGQSLVDDLRFYRRFRQCRQREVDWRPPTDAERRHIDEHPILGRFGDMTQLVADVGARRWIVRDRDWHGWPDPPEFVFFALEGEAIWAARDFDGWPSAWGAEPAKRRAVDAEKP